MPSLIECPNCKSANPLNRRFCLSCGQELDLENPIFINEVDITPEVPEEFQTSPKLWLWETLQSLIVISVKLTLFALFVLGTLACITSHVSHPTISMKGVKSFNHKWKDLSKTRSSNYQSFNEEEINIFLERTVSSYIKTLNNELPNFLKVEKVFCTVNNGTLKFFHILKLWKKTLAFEIKGDLSNPNELSFKPLSLKLGKCPLPLVLEQWITPWLQKTLETSKAVELPRHIGAIEVSKDQILVFLRGKMAKSKTSTSSQATEFQNQENISDDVLLIQAGNSFFERKRYENSLKYYELALLLIPNSPFKEYIKQQIAYCNEGIKK